MRPRVDATSANNRLQGLRLVSRGTGVPSYRVGTKALLMSWHYTPHLKRLEILHGQKTAAGRHVGSLDIDLQVAFTERTSRCKNRA